MKMLQSAISEAFTVEEILAQTPYHILYKGYDKDSGQQVLIQHWPTAVIASTQEEERLNQEVALFQQMIYPYILPISQVLVQQRGISLISSYPRQGSLQARLSQHSFQPFPLNEARVILWQVGEALHHAHQQGFLHGALTPGAIFFTEDNQAVVTGFRFQSILAAIPNYRPEQEARLPKLWYMAPEQFVGVLNEKSDQYMLGCLAYALLTGHVPFPGYTYATLRRKHQGEPPKLLTVYNPDIPANIEDAVLMALAKQAENRHESMQDFLRALEEPVRQHTPSTRSLSGIDAALDNRAGSMAVRRMNIPPLRAISQSLSGNLSGIYDKNNILAKMANIQGYSRLVSGGKRLYIPALILLILAITITATLIASGVPSKSVRQISSITAPAPAKKATPSMTPTPIIGHGQISPVVTATPAQGPQVVPSPTAAPIPAGGTAPTSCHIDYMINSQNNNGTFSANINIFNTGTTNINGWTLVFVFPDAGQRINTIVSADATFSQNNQQVIMNNASFAAFIPAGAPPLTVSVTGTWTNANPVPTSFTLNNVQCN